MSERRRTSPRWLGFGVLLLGSMGLEACSAELKQAPASPKEAVAGGHGIKTPLGVEEARQPELLAPGPDVDLTHFAPLLADDGLLAVRQAVFEEDYAKAAALYEQSLEAEREHGTLSAEQAFQFARLLMLAEDYGRASREYERASQTQWVLSEYAQFLAGQTALSGGESERALRLLSELPTDWPFSDRASVLKAEAHLALNAPEQALDSLRPVLEQSLQSELWARAHLLAGQAIVAEQLREGQKPSMPALVSALSFLRKVSTRLPEHELGKQSLELEKQILGRLEPEVFAEHQQPGREEQLVRLGALVQGYRYEDANIAAEQLMMMAGPKQRFDATDCEARVLRAKALAGKRKWGKAADFLGDAIKRCKGEDLGARARYLAGKFSQFDKRYSKAVRHFEALEKKYPKHRLADDARLRRARCYAELGDESRFTQLLSSMPQDYPQGDMLLDGVFELALRHMERGDWSTVSNILDRAIGAAKQSDVSRDHEYAGRERYFRARAFIESGEQEAGFKEFESLIEERPLSYYMQLAYSRLQQGSAERAEAARLRALEKTRAQPFAFAHTPDFESPNFLRALALTRVGALDYAERELRALGGVQKPELLWAIALLYSRGGATSQAHKLARGQLTDWLGRWPVGDWAQAWELAFPRPFRQFVTQAADKQELPESLIYAVMREESAFDARVVSPAHAYGLMQLIRPTAKHFAKKEGLPYSEAALKRPRVNIALGARVLRDYTDRFPDNPELAIPGYNAGPGRPKRWKRERAHLDFDVWVETIPFTETRRYTKRVLASRGVYAFLYEGEHVPLLPVHLKP